MESNETYEDKTVKAEYTYEALKDRLHNQDERIKSLEACIKEAIEYMDGTEFRPEGYTFRVFDMRFVSNMNRILRTVDINRRKVINEL